LTDAPPRTEPPTDEPTPATAGSASTISAQLLLQLEHRLERDVGEARVEPITKPLSSVGK
jgi:hypothetical protein